MESILKRVIKADKEARGKIDDVLIKKNNMQDELEQHKCEIKLKYQADNKKRLSDEQKVLAKVVADKKKSEQMQYDEAVKSLNEAYEKNCDFWVSSIFDQCINS